MNTLSRTFIAISTVAALCVAETASAVPVQAPPPDCNRADVKVTNISIAGGATVYNNTPGTSSIECVGAFSGNAIPIPQTNLGYYGDGLFNGAPQGGNGSAIFPNGVFSGQYTAVDLNHDGKVDPGWILLGKWAPGTNGAFSFTPSLIGGTNTIVLSNWFSATGTGSSGTWSFTPDANVVNRVLPILGSNLFDQFALSFMAGSRFAAYDFTGAQFNMPASPNTIYNFSGTWDMSDTLVNNGGQSAALSHIDLYVRDPNGGDTQIPEPASLALLGLALAGLGLSRRKSA